MPIDTQKLNQIYNQLKEMVGDEGAFILFCAKDGGDMGEDTQVRTYGPGSRQIGMIDTCVPFLREHLVRQFNERMKRLPAEPD